MHLLVFSIHTFLLVLITYVFLKVVFNHLLKVKASSRLFGSSVTVSSFIFPDKAAAEDPGAPGPRGPAAYRACASERERVVIVGPRGPGRPRESSAASCVSSSHLSSCDSQKKIVLSCPFSKKKCRFVQRSQG